MQIYSVSYVNASALTDPDGQANDWMENITDALWGDNNITLVSFDRVRKALLESGATKDSRQFRLLAAAAKRGASYVNLEG